MAWRSGITKNWLGGAVGALLAVLIGVGLGFFRFGQGVPLGQGLVLWSYDLPFAFRPNLNPTNAVIVYMDEDSHRALQQAYHAPWDYSLHARLLERLRADQAKLVVMDVLFTEAKSTNALSELAAAIKAHGRVVIGSDYKKRTIPGGGTLESFTYPLEPLQEAAAGSGLVTLIQEVDFGVRQRFTGKFDGPDYVPTLAWRAAEILRESVSSDPQQRDREHWLNYYGHAECIPTTSYYLALRPDGVPPGFFQDRIVFIGEKPPATELPGAKKEEFRTPYTWWTGQFSPGVDIQATTFLNLARQDWLRRMHPGLELLVLTLSGLVFGYGLTLFRPLPAAGLALGSMVTATMLAYLLFSVFRIWFAWLLVVVVQIPIGVGWAILFNSVRLYVEKRVLEESLALHLSPARVRQILKRPELLRPGAEKQEISILFSDIANFSRITSHMEPEDLFKLLNNYFETALAAIHQTDGTVIKLIGDSIFAIWNAPFVQPNQQIRACQAALELGERLTLFQARERSLPLRTRVGLHTGLAHVGNVGSTARFDYTAIGDSVNLASRLEGLNKYLGTDLLATRDIQKFVENSIVGRRVGHFKLKGIDHVVEVHELVGLPEKAGNNRPWIEAFEDALYHFQRAAFDRAEAGFRRTMELHPDDGPSLFYLEKIKEFRAIPPPEDWTGEIEFKEK